MKGIKSFLISSVLILSILLSSCAGNGGETPSGNDVTDTKPADTTAVKADDSEEITDDEKLDADNIDPEYSYEKWVEHGYGYLKYITIDTDGEVSADSSSLAWGMSYLLDTLCRGYCATGDIAFLEQLAIYVYKSYEGMADNDGDGYLSWGTGHYSGGVYEEFAVHIGMMLATAGEFVFLIKGDSELSQKDTPLGMTYGELADYIIDRSVNHAIPSFDCDWNEELGVYMSRSGSGVYDGAEEIYSLPHNQYLAFAIGLMHFAKFSPEHTDEYLHRAEKMLTTFKNCVTWFPNIGVAAWNYNDPLFEGDHYTYRQEDFSHGMLDVRAAIIGYENGLVFTLEDINMLAKTYDTIMYRQGQEYPALSDYVDGTGESVGRIRLWNYDVSIYSPRTVLRGMEYMIFNSKPVNEDTLTVLSYHHDTPTPEQFSVTMPTEGAADVSPDNAIFIWQRGAKANYYRLQVSTDAEFTDIIVDRDKIINNAAVVDGLPANTELYVRVIAMNMKGEGTVCEAHSFSTAES